MVGNDAVNWVDYLGLLNRENVAREINWNRPSKECKCWSLWATADWAYTWTHGNDVGFSARWWLNANQKRGEGCACECKRVKLVQYVKTEGIHLSLPKKGRTHEDWRIDIAHGDFNTPYISDTIYGGMLDPDGFGEPRLQGNVKDFPKSRRISIDEDGVNKKGVFTALTCLICADKSAAEAGKIIGCLEWGYSFTQSVEDGRRAGAKNLQYTKPILHCGDSDFVRNARMNAEKGFNEAHPTVNLKEKLWGQSQH
jgi:hypothetical protein